MLDDDDPGRRRAQELGPDRDDIHVLHIGDEELRSLASQKGDQARKRGERARGVERDYPRAGRNDFEQLAATAMDEKRHPQTGSEERRREADVQPLRPAAGKIGQVDDQMCARERILVVHRRRLMRPILSAVAPVRQ